MHEKLLKGPSMCGKLRALLIERACEKKAKENGYEMVKRRMVKRMV